ncbi:MAG: Kelch repeat-containing protein [Thermoleophilaceae bacterium]
MRAPRRKNAPRLPAWLLPSVIVVVIALVGMKAAGVGPDLPGPKILQTLGLAERFTPLQYCSPKPSQIKNPSSPLPGSGSWLSGPNMPVPEAEHTGAVLGGLVYIVGGQDMLGRSQKHVLTFDPRTRRYGRIPDMPLEVDHAIVVAHRGNIYVEAGYRHTYPVAALFRYSPRTRTWTTLATPPTARGGAGGAVIGNKLYVVAGAPRSSPPETVAPYRNLEIYDFRANSWSSGPPLPTGRHHVAVAAMGSQLFVAGGRKPNDLASQNFERFDTRTGKWTELGKIPLGLAAMGVVQHGSKMIIVGGGDDSGWQSGGGYVSPAAFVYDSHTGKWSRMADLPRGEHAPAVAIAGGRIWAFGGIDCPGFHPTGNTYSLPLG